VVVLVVRLLVLLVMARLAVKAVPRMHSFGRKWSVGCWNCWPLVRVGVLLYFR